jgi:hypothetical protein
MLLSFVLLSQQIETTAPKILVTQNFSNVN